MSTDTLAAFALVAVLGAIPAAGLIYYLWDALFGDGSIPSGKDNTL